MRVLSPPRLIDHHLDADIALVPSDLARLGGLFWEPFESVMQFGLWFIDTFENLFHAVAALDAQAAVLAKYCTDAYHADHAAEALRVLLTDRVPELVDRLSEVPPHDFLAGKEMLVHRSFECFKDHLTHDKLALATAALGRFEKSLVHYQKFRHATQQFVSQLHPPEPASQQDAVKLIVDAQEVSHELVATKNDVAGMMARLLAIISAS